jgi:hypothetical protein
MGIVVQKRELGYFMVPPHDEVSTKHDVTPQGYRVQRSRSRVRLCPLPAVGLVPYELVP